MDTFGLVHICLSESVKQFDFFLIEQPFDHHETVFLELKNLVFRDLKVMHSVVGPMNELHGS
jgi:hypothetical protein